jgi:hypothetical protein
MNTIDIEPHLFNRFDINNITYSKVHDKNGKKIIYVTDQNKKKIYIQTPELLYTSQISQKSNYNEMILPFKGLYKQEKIILFKQFIEKLDNKLVQDASLYGRSWFGESENVSYRSLIKTFHIDTIDTIEQSDGIFDNGLIKFKINDKVLISINSDSISINELKHNTPTRIIFQIYALWVSDNLFGLHLLPIKINQKLKIIENIKFIDSTDDSSESSHSSDELDNNFCCSEMAENKTSSHEDIESTNPIFSIANIENLN